MDRLSDGESEHEEYNYNEDGGKSNDSDSSESDEGPLLDWGDVVHYARPDVCQDEISTICYSLSNYSSDSGHHGFLFPNNNINRLPSSVSSSNGTIEQFIGQFTCRVCEQAPTTAVAHVIWSNFYTFEESRFHINGDGLV